MGDGGKDEVKGSVCASIESEAERIMALSDSIMRNPEPGFREFRTAERVRAEFARMGLAYREGLGLTGVKARMTGGSPGPTVALLGELDALLMPAHPYADPDTKAAHACGHNSQVASMIGAGIGLQAVMATLTGDVVLFAVPAEECIEIEWRSQLKAERQIEFLVGKAELIRLGEFDDIDMALITHTFSHGRQELASVGDSHNGAVIKHVEYSGKAAHAGGAPWFGANALKAAMLGLGGIDLQREQFREEDCVRVHFIITEGGQAVSAVPARARLEGMVRARTVEAMEEVSARVDRSLKAGALALGVDVRISTYPAYFPHVQDAGLVRLVHDNAAAVVGEERMAPPVHRSGSTDMGDLSLVMPVAHPRSGGVRGTTHSSDYVVEDHYAAAVNPAKWMAMTVVDLLWDGAAGARHILEGAGKKLTRDDYVTLRRRFDVADTFSGRAG